MAFYNEQRKTIQCDDCPLLLSQSDLKRCSHCEEHRQEHSSEILDHYPEGSFARIFWNSQCKALSQTKLSSMKWDPVMIRWCLYLRHLAGGSAYEMLRQTFR